MSPWKMKDCTRVWLEGGFVVKYVKNSTTSLCFSRNDRNKMLIFYFDDTLNGEAEGLNWRNSAEMFSRRHLWTFYHCLSAYSRAAHLPVSCFVVDIYGPDWNVIVTVTWPLGQRCWDAGGPVSLLHECLRDSTLSVFQCVIVVWWNVQTFPVSRAPRGPKACECVNPQRWNCSFWTNAEMRAGRNTSCVPQPQPPSSVYTVWLKGLL